MINSKFKMTCCLKSQKLPHNNSILLKIFKYKHEIKLNLLLTILLWILAILLP